MNQLGDIPRGTCLAICDFETTGVDTSKDLPIEVGVLFCDHELRVVRSVDSLIAVSEFDESHFGAIPIHGITPPMLRNAPTAGEVAQMVIDAAASAKRMTRASKVVLCSDNAQFEHAFMRRLLGDQWPFHYCTWDSSLLLEMTGVGDPIPRHRALADAGLLLEALLEARSRIRSWTRG